MFRTTTVIGKKCFRDFYCFICAFLCAALWSTELIFIGAPALPIDPHCAAAPYCTVK